MEQRHVPADGADRRGHVLVVGGGIAGLAAAHELCHEHRVTLCEASIRLGGRIATATFRDRPVDCGPDAFVTRDPTAADLCLALGLGDDLIAPATNRAAIAVRKGIRPLPAGLVLGLPTRPLAVAASGLLPPMGLARAGVDLIWPARLGDLRAEAVSGGADPSVGALLRRRFGRSVVDRLVAPLVGGINAGDVDELSFAATLPDLARALQGKRSLVRSLRRQRRPTAGEPAFLGLAGGLQGLVDALALELSTRGARVRTATAVKGIVHGSSDEAAPRWLVETGGGPLQVDGVVLAVEPSAASTFVRPLRQALADELGAIRSASVATVTMAFPAGTTARYRGLAGVLVPRRRGAMVTAFSFTSAKWPHAAAPGEEVLRASLGRIGEEEPLALDDEALVDAVHGELAELTGIDSPPFEHLVTRFPASFPQYVSGHLARLRRIDEAVGTLPGLELCGSAYGGIGIPACIRSGRDAARRVAAALAAR